MGKKNWPKCAKKGLVHALILIWAAIDTFSQNKLKIAAVGKNGNFHKQDCKTVTFLKRC